MIGIIRGWCEGIIIAIINSVIIELLIQEGNNKKYVKVVVGIYIIFVTINPILKLIDYDFNFEDFFNLKTEEVSINLDSDIKDVYILGIEETIKKEIEELGYNVNFVNVQVDKKYENIESIQISVTKKVENTIDVEPVIIGDTNKPNLKYDDIIKFLKENYLVDKDKIIFK